MKLRRDGIDRVTEWAEVVNKVVTNANDKVVVVIAR